MPADEDFAGAALAPGTRALLRERLVPSLLPFAGHVVRLVAHPLGVVHPSALEALRSEERAALGLTELLDSVVTGGATTNRAVMLLADDATLLSACFQNLDLLPTGDPAGDAVALLVMAAMEHSRPGP